MRTKYSLTTLGLAGIMLMSSCTQDDTKSDPVNRHAMKFTYSVDGLNNENKTRATVPTAPGEDKVQNIHLFFFEASDNRDGEFVECVTLDQNLQMGQSHGFTGGTLTAADEYNVIAIANIEDNHYISSSVSDWISQWENSTEREFSENVLASIAFAAAPAGIESDRIPMSGWAYKPAGSGDVNVNLIRVVSRLDLINNDTDYELLSVSVWNAYYTSSLTGDAVPDYSTSRLGSRTQKYYAAHDCSNDEAIGQLYVFENQVITPANGDRFTTCLIVGLEHKVTKDVHYYRINIHPNGSPQNLKRNNAYIVTVTSVVGDGAATEEDAYTGVTTELFYTINYWDLDDNGLIVSDMYSILAIPTKTVRLGQEPSNNSYAITTFSTLANPAPLAIKSQNYSPADGKIVATLSGHTLYINAAKLENGDPDRSGIITVSFADLEASINVLQSSSVDKFLTVTLEEGFNNLLSATAHASSENVNINASGPWTAKLYDNNTPFAFTLGADWVTRKSELLSTSIATNRFRISTWSGNPDNDEREGFVIISLDEDPLNYVSVVPISQKVASKIDLVPDIDQMTFNGAGTVTYPLNGNNVIKINSGSDFIDGVALSGADAGQFVLSHPTISGSDNNLEVTVTTLENNYTGTTFSATLTISTTGGTKTVNLRQTSLGLTLSPNSISSEVSAKGGATEYVTVSVGQATNLVYKAEITTYGNVYNHEAYIELENGNKGTLLTNVPTTQRFRIVFPKVYYPNRDENISATVKITVEDLDEEISAKQTALKSQGLHVWSSNRTNYGALTENTSGGYFLQFRTYFNSYKNVISPSNNSMTEASSTSQSNNTPSNYSKYTWVHLSNSHLSNSNYSFTNVDNYRNTVDGLFLMNGDEYNSNGLSMLRNSPFGKIGYTFASYTSSGVRSYVNHSVSDTRVYKMIMEYGRSTLSDAKFYQDGVATSATNVPSTGVPLVLYDNGNVMLAIDPTNQMVYSGDCTVFHTDSYMTRSGTQSVYEFMYNYMDYLCLAAMYGSHFTDLMIDRNASDPDYLPAPWDDAWGQNKWDKNNIK